MNRFTYENHPNYYVKTPKLIYVDRYGNIYPDCKTYKTRPICHITEKNAVDIVYEQAFGTIDRGIFNMITIEVSSVCQANCLYCFQNDAHRNEKYAFYDYLLSFLERIEAYWVFFSGGEILIQKEAMNFMRMYRASNPNAWIHLKSNGNAGEAEAKFVSEVCNSIMVSFNGFSSSSYRTIMGLNIEKTKRFCKIIKENRKTNLGVKLLNSPISISETPEFLEWAFSITPKCIAVQNAFNYAIDASGKSTKLESTLPERDCSPYWENVYKSIGLRCDSILDKWYNKINNGSNYLTADKDFLNLVVLSPRNKNLFRTDGVYVIE